MGHQHMAFIGKRADMMIVEGAEVKDGLVYKNIDYYTIECPECDGTGYYDERGDVICDNCGLMLGGEPVLPTEHDKDNMEGKDEGTMTESSRGLKGVKADPISDPAPEKYD